MKVNWNQFKINWNQLKVNWKQLKVTWIQLKVTWDQLKVNWNQLKVTWNQLKVNWNQFESIVFFFFWFHRIAYPVLWFFLHYSVSKICLGGGLPTLICNLHYIYICIYIYIL